MPPTTATKDLVTEIESTLLESRDARALRGTDERHPPFTPRELSAHERAVMLDITLALLIRHRLPIDADRAAKAVADAQDPDARTWASRCADHVACIAEETRR
jgi:hypothetical protein